MTEQKKAFIEDALDAVADEFIAEAVEYQKTKLTWKYTRELAAVFLNILRKSMTEHCFAWK